MSFVRSLTAFTCAQRMPTMHTRTRNDDDSHDTHVRATTRTNAATAVDASANGFASG
jgi:hypothetical protein